MEFFADNAEIFSAIYPIYHVLNFILGFYAQFKANHSNTKNLFFFEGIENNKFEELKKIKEFINTAEEKEIKIYTRSIDKYNKIENEKLDNTTLSFYSTINPIKDLNNNKTGES